MRLVFTPFFSKQDGLGIRCELRTLTGHCFVGHSVCSTKDRFDLEKGKRIAELRAKQRQLQRIIKILNQDIEANLTLMNDLEAIVDRNENKIARDEKKLYFIEDELEKLTEEPVE